MNARNRTIACDRRSICDARSTRNRLAPGTLLGITALSLLLGAGTVQTVLADIPCDWEPTFGTSLALTDDSTAQVNFGFSFPFQGNSYTSGYVSSNGFIAFGSDPGSQCCDGDIAAFLAGPPRISLAWHDIDPGAGGQVAFQSFGTYAVITWNQTPELSSTNWHNMQILLFDDGTITFAYDVLEPVPTDHRHHGLVGITPGGGAADPGEIDLSAGLPFSSGATGTIYEFFARGPNGATGPDPDPFDLSSSAITFVPNPTGGYTTVDCAGGCSAVPIEETSCLVAPKSKLQIKDSATPGKDKLSWQWGAGAAFDQADLAAPQADTVYTLCIYDETATVPSLEAALDIAASPTLWTTKDPKGFAYKDKAGSSEGITKAQLKTGAAGKTKVKVSAGGANLVLPAAAGATFFNQDPNVVVQLFSSTGKCWTSEFASADTKTNVTEAFKAQVK